MQKVFHLFIHYTGFKLDPLALPEPERGFGLAWLDEEKA